LLCEQYSYLNNLPAAPTSTPAAPTSTPAVPAQPSEPSEPSAYEQLLSHSPAASPTEAPAAAAASPSRNPGAAQALPASQDLTKDEWSSQWDPSARKYYYYNKAGKTQWTKPPTFDAAPSQTWTEHSDPATGKVYYANQCGVTQWDKPTDYQPVKADPDIEKQPSGTDVEKEERDQKLPSPRTNYLTPQPILPDELQNDLVKCSSFNTQANSMGRLRKLETIVLGQPQKGGLLLRLAAVEKTYYGKDMSGPIVDRLQQLEDSIGIPMAMRASTRW